MVGSTGADMSRMPATRPVGSRIGVAPAVDRLVRLEIVLGGQHLDRPLLRQRNASQMAFARRRDVAPPSLSAATALRAAALAQRVWCRRGPQPCTAQVPQYWSRW